MSERDRPDLAMAAPSGTLRAPASPVPARRYWRLLLLSNLAVLACAVVLLLRPAAPTTTSATPPAVAAPEQQRVLAVELEQRSLSGQAARAWESYLAADPDIDSRAEILYRIGKLHTEADRFDEAAATFVRAQLAAGGNKRLQAQIGAKLIDCLRRLGRYGEVGRELSRRVEVGGEDTGRGRVLATFAGEQLTESDLDRIIERRVDHTLAFQAAGGDETARKEVLRRFATPEMRQQVLREVLQTELFSRRARELKLDRQEAFLRAREQLEQNLLASTLLRREFEKIQPTDLDLEAYYQAQGDHYREPETMDLVLVKIGTDDEPAKILEQVQSADDFRQLARDRQSTDDHQQLTHRVVRGRTDRTLGDTTALFALAEGEWSKQPHLHGDKKYLCLVEAKTEARSPSLAQVRGQVQSDFIARKQQELSEKLLRDLMLRYDVRHRPPEQPDQKPADEKHHEEKAE